MKSLIAMLALVLCGQVFAADGNYIAKLAEAHERVTQGKGAGQDAFNYGRLEGFVIAVADEASLMGMLCTPDQVTYDQLVAVVKKAIREQPDRWHLQGYMVVQMALFKAFPCAKK